MNSDLSYLAAQARVDPWMESDATTEYADTISSQYPTKSCHAETKTGDRVGKQKDAWAYLLPGTCGRVSRDGQRVVDRWQRATKEDRFGDEDGPAQAVRRHELVFSGHPDGRHCRLLGVY